jgi:hypothetical protein
MQIIFDRQKVYSLLEKSDETDFVFPEKEVSGKVLISTCHRRFIGTENRLCFACKAIMGAVTVQV